MRDPEGGQFWPGAKVVEKATTNAGEVVLLEVRMAEGRHYELRINGTYVMATYCRESEKELAAIALEALGQRPGARVLIGGLGMGMTLQRTLSAPWVSSVVVVEVEPCVEQWCRRYFGPFNGLALDDPRVAVHLQDIGAFVQGATDSFDAILLDMDNGPDQVILPQNASLYSDDGLRRWADMLTPGGVLAVWSARPDERFADRARRFYSEVVTHTVDTAQSVHSPWPDVVFCARR